MSTRTVFNEEKLIKLKKDCAKRAKTKGHDYQVEKFQTELLTQNFKKSDIVDATCKMYGTTRVWAENLFNSVERSTR